MKRAILNITLTLALILMPAITLTGNAYAATCGSETGNSKQQALYGVGEVPGDCSGSGVTRAIRAAVIILSIIVGAAAIVMIVLAGFKYITSGGDANKVANAKNTLIYALVGIAVAVLAQILVNVVITTSNRAICPAGKHLDSHNNCVAN